MISSPVHRVEVLHDLAESLQIVLYIAFRGTDVFVPCHVLYLPQVMAFQPVHNDRGPELFGTAHLLVLCPQFLYQYTHKGELLPVREELVIMHGAFDLPHQYRSCHFHVFP